MFSILAAAAKTSRLNKTGSWRSTKMPEFYREECISCGLCEFICPEACINQDQDNNYSADMDYCKGCGLCTYICPKNAVKMVENNPTENKNKDKG